MAKQRVIISGDWAEGVEDLKSFLHAARFEVETESFADLKSAVKKKAADGVVYAINGSSSEALASLRDLKRYNDSLPVFFYANTVSDVPYVVEVVKQGVCNFFVAPLQADRLIEQLTRELHLYQLTNKIFKTGGLSIDEDQFESMIGRSKPMQDNFQMISAVAKSNATVLITGESGVGKELVAQAIHRRSERNQGRFVDLNCGAIPKELLENELFGHEKGSFTGAHKRYIGSFETADLGTLFLDEISEMDVLLQVKLLRVLQERTLQRIGGNESIKIDVRIIAATNRNLHKEIETGRFREDLYYRLNVVNIEIPSLRERREDIPLLAKHFLEYYSAKNNRIFIDFANDCMEAMINYDWPGNVRELENTIERIVVLNDTTQVLIKHLPSHIQKVDCAIGYASAPEASQSSTNIIPLEDLERQAIEAALAKFHGNIAVVARKLKIGQATLYRKVKKFGLSY